MSDYCVGNTRENVWPCIHGRAKGVCWKCYKEELKEAKAEIERLKAECESWKATHDAKSADWHKVIDENERYLSVIVLARKYRESGSYADRSALFEAIGAQAKEASK